MQDKTIILITHHLQEVKHMDRVIFLERGTIALDSTPSELARTNARYQKLLTFDRGLER